MSLPAGVSLLTPEDVALRLQVRPFTVREYLRTGKIRGIQVARKWRVTEEALAEFIQALDQDARK